MDLLAQHEAFLRAIFDTPDDDTPRLVYADFLEENGEEDRAEFIRWQCNPTSWAKPQFTEEIWGQHTRGFREAWRSITLRLERLNDVSGFRKYAVTQCPECFAVESVSLCDGRIKSVEPFDALFGLLAFARVKELDIRGVKKQRIPEQVGNEGVPYDPNSFNALWGLIRVPTITSLGVESLAQHQGAIRLSSLILTDNAIDDKAALALVNSPFLVNLKRLDLGEDSPISGKVWRQLTQRFGEDVVG